MPNLLKMLRKIGDAFKEKPTVEPDDFEFEHFLVYHGLVGSSPANQRKFKDVRADIRLAVENESPEQISIALKVHPLWWEDKLKSIISELSKRELLVSMLAPDVEPEKRSPLLHESWQVRANATNLLVHLEAREVVEQIVESLHDTANNARLAYCHQAYALGQLDTPEGTTALHRYLEDSDPWIRVDTAGALAQAGKIDAPLLDALLAPHLLSDYTAVAAARSFSVSALLSSEDEPERLAGCAMVTGITHAASQTFPNEVVVETGVYKCLPQLVEILKDKVEPLSTRAALSLRDWIEREDNYQHLEEDYPEEQIYYLDELAEKDAIADAIRASLAGQNNNALKDSKLDLRQLESAVFLAGELQIEDCRDAVGAMLEPEHPLFEEAIDTVGKLKDADAAARLVELAGDLVNLEERTDKERSSNPVVEDAGIESKRYWRILRAMANIPTTHVRDFLVTAAGDHASDKRLQALESLFSVTEELGGETPEPVVARAREALLDRSAEIRIAALKGAANLEITDSLEQVGKLTAAREVSVSRQALATLSELANKGHRDKVVTLVNNRLKSGLDQYQRDKLNKLLENIQK